MMNTLLTFAFQVAPNLENKVSGGNENELFVWISLAAGVLALGLGIYIFTVLNALKKKQESITAEIASLLENKSSSDRKAEEVFRVTAERRLDELENRVYAIENPPRTKEWSSSEVVVNKPAADFGKQKPMHKKGKEGLQNERTKADGVNTAARADIVNTVTRTDGANTVTSGGSANTVTGAGSVSTGKLPAEGGIEKKDHSVPLAGKGDGLKADGGTGQAQSSQNFAGQKVSEPAKTAELPKVPEQQKTAVESAKEELPKVELPKEELFYAKFPDRKGAFSTDELLPVQNGELVYEVKLKDGEGVYEISQDIDAQKYALSDVNYYLSEGCDFINQPSKDSWIINKSAGKLIQSGGTWIIQEKAVIEFR